jgi:hypothetical protein
LKFWNTDEKNSSVTFSSAKSETYYNTIFFRVAISFIFNLQALIRLAIKIARAGAFQGFEELVLNV